MAFTKSILRGRSSEIALDEPYRALREADRCLGCYDAPCISGCPTRINIPEFIGRIRTDNLEGAYHTLVSANPLPAICGAVCPTEYLCESKCVLTQLTGKPVEIAALQRYVCTQAAINENCTSTLSARVAVVGGGPAGLACAIRLRRRGYLVDLYDEHQQLGGLLYYSIPNYRLPDSAVQKELERVEKSGVKLHLGTVIDHERLERIFAEYAAVFISLGLSGGKTYRVPGVKLGGVWQALNYLEAMRKAGRGEGPLPDRVGHLVVVGGGNVALDAACVAAQSTAEKVTVIYRRSQVEMPAWESEYLDALSLGIEFRWLTDLTEIIDQQGCVGGVQVQRMRLLDQIDGDGRRPVEPVPGSDEIVHCDAVVLAIGQALRFDGLQTLGLEVDAGVLKVDPEMLQTTRPHVFAGGDLVRGASFVVQAVADGMRAAKAIHHSLGGED